MIGTSASGRWGSRLAAIAVIIGFYGKIFKAAIAPAWTGRVGTLEVSVLVVGCGASGGGKGRSDWGGG